MNDGTLRELHNPADMPDPVYVDFIEEPWINATILVPDEHLGAVLKLWMLGTLGLATGAVTFLAEAIGFWIAYGVSPLMVLQLDFDFSAGIRPGWYVLMVCALFLLVAALRQRPDTRRSELATA